MATFEDDSSLGILSSAFAAMTGIPLQSGDPPSVETESQTETIKLTALNLCHISVNMAIQEPQYPFFPAFVFPPYVTVRVVMLKSNKQVTLNVSVDTTVKKIREDAAAGFDMCPTTLTLIYEQKQLEDHQVWREIVPRFKSGSVIFGVKCYPGEKMGMFKLDPESLAPEFDHDFTNEEDDGETYLRGMFEYLRPYGWKRYGIKVAGEYNDDVWLGENAFRTKKTQREWPVSYHGTAQCNIRGLVEEGYWMGQRQRFGPGVYTSPCFTKVAEQYSKTFIYNENQYRVILQNRVNEQCFKIISPERTGQKDFPYWVSNPQDPGLGVLTVRPYGILIKLFNN